MMIESLMVLLPRYMSITQVRLAKHAKLTIKIKKLKGIIIITNQQGQTTREFNYFQPMLLTN